MELIFLMDGVWNIRSDFSFADLHNEEGSSYWIFLALLYFSKGNIMTEVVENCYDIIFLRHEVIFAKLY